MEIYQQIAGGILFFISVILSLVSRYAEDIVRKNSPDGPAIAILSAILSALALFAGMVVLIWSWWSLISVLILVLIWAIIFVPRSYL